MRRCKHSRWLSVTDHHETSFSLQVSNRLDRLVQDVQEPENKQPRLWLFLGGKSKSTALRSLCSSFTPGGAGRRHDLHLHLDARSVFSRKPVLIADGDLMPRRFGEDLTAQCHRVDKSDIPCAITTDAYDLIYTRLLCPFAEVVCVFLMDFPDLDALKSRLLTWAEHERTSSLPKAADPHLLLVMDMGSQLHHATVVEEMKSSLSACLSDLPFSSVSTVRLSPNGQVSQVSRHQVLKDTLLKFSDRVRIRRADARYLFSTVHLSAFFSLALAQMKVLDSGPFDFIQSARLHHPVAPSLSSHLTDSLRGYSSLFEVTNTGLPLIAASLLVDHYLPEMHRKSAWSAFRNKLTQKQ
jgi:hypothetical protein